MFRKRPGHAEPETAPQGLEAEIRVPETVIAPGTTVRGTIQGRNAVRVGGFLEGQISIEDLAWIDRHGEVQGTVRAREVIIEGQVRGDIEASEKIEVRASGRVTGNIRCHRFVVAEGGFVQGQIKMPGEGSQPPPPLEKGDSAEDEGEPETGD